MFLFFFKKCANLLARLTTKCRFIYRVWNITELLSRVFFFSQLSVASARLYSSAVIDEERKRHEPKLIHYYLRWTRKFFHASRDPRCQSVRRETERSAVKSWQFNILLLRFYDWQEGRSVTVIKKIIYQMNLICSVNHDFSIYAALNDFKLFTRVAAAACLRQNIGLNKTDHM